MKLFVTAGRTRFDILINMKSTFFVLRNSIIQNSLRYSSDKNIITKTSTIDSLNTLKKQNLPIAKHTVDYPWLMSYEPPRVPAPSIWASIKNRHLLKSGKQIKNNLIQK